ncbi:Glycosyl-hydrolase 97 C-terminal, oligomerisation [Pustulibacterium marinum]|uniref:Glycosyl-hydrolase 97 C-terminal, oligomerisation n=1 Tax=Pustulibacterium marinum TaxID=1224947 RepID=A0A1I7EVD7_9FLAO|nr:glycoside hydrolase family 97 protein [Pustulibacterium marinum]SFU27891.1 Glycosyl-hydrolase 97 C-terminal, oligomerisation [Pustulibacterium marinum]
MRILKILLLGLVVSCSSEKVTNEESYTVNSPENNVAVNFFLSPEGQPMYSVAYHNKAVIDTSKLSFELINAPELKSNFQVTKTEDLAADETWEMAWGEQRTVRNHYKGLKVYLEERSDLKRKMNLIFKVYDDGIGFRYEFPEQENLKEVLIKDEHTQFQLTGDHIVWWQPGDWDIYEHLYNTSTVSGIDAISKRNHQDLAQTTIPENAVNTPVTMKAEDGVHMSFHEAALLDYAGMTLKVNTDDLSLESNLVGSANHDYKVKRTTPFATPWRTIQLADDAAGLISSKLIVNLNEPNKLGDVSWFTPMKYVGIWWEMHLGKSTWDMSASQDMNSFTKASKPHGKHGATTENAKHYIDFAAENNIKGLLVEGWNTGWEHWIGFEDREGVFDFVTPYPDYDLEEVVEYGKEKGVQLIMHHETSAAPRTYEQQQDTAYALMKKLDIHSVKSGYVGKIIPKGEYHHGQWMVNQYNNAAFKAAKYEVAVNAHEPIKATGLRRTYPNIISREGLRGQEFNAWATDGGNPPEHLPIIAFTRMLAGPIDYTPGIFNIKLDPYKSENQVNTTIAQQLALYVVIYSPIQMAADLPEFYEGQPGLQFIRDVGVDWEQTKVLNGEVGDYVTIAREEKETGNWFLGSISDENARDVEVKLDFLDKDADYKVTLYKDGKNAHWNDNPTDMEVETLYVDSSSTLKLHLAPGGGAAISFMKM